MTLLKQETLFSVIDAAIDAGLEYDTLLLSMPREAQASLVRPSTRSTRELYLSLFSQLNEWGASDRKDPPLRKVMHNMQFLAGARVQASIFQRALSEIDGASSGVNERGELLFMRAKDCYVERGYRVVPPPGAPTSLTFQAWRGTSAVSVIGVAAVAPLNAVIDTVRTQVEQLAGWERVEGCVVLDADDPSEVEQVRRAGLVAVPYSELAPMGVREITAFVDRQQAELAQGLPAPSGRDVCREVRAALREGPVRVVTVNARNVMECARRIVLELTSDYLRNPARAAPLLLPLSSRPSPFPDLVAAAFKEHRVPFSRFDFPGLLAEKAFLPVFVADPAHCTWSAAPEESPAREVLARGSKVVLVTAEKDPVAPHEVAHRWSVPARHVRAFSAGKGPTLVRPEPQPDGTKGGDTSRFERGRALLVGVASYERVSKLPESVLNDARDLATLLKSPARGGYLDTNVELLLDQDATAARFRLGLQRLAEKTRAEDTVVVFFSGHGLRQVDGDRAEAYLLPIDYDPRNLERTALSATELTRLLGAIQAKRLVVLLDACHAAGAAQLKTGAATATFKSGLDDKTYEALGRGAGRVVIASSRADELSCVLPGMNNSLFTAYLLEALAGAAASEDEDFVRVLDVFHHISENVPLRATQHPVLKAQDVENNFPVALSPRSKRALGLRWEGPKRSVGTNANLVASALPAKARLAIKHALIRRWDDLADYFEIPLSDKAKFDRGYEGQRTLEWLEERGRLHELRQAFAHFRWDDLLAELDRHSA
ncbi:MAG: 5-methylthioadenosine/S-adenosylhomocysteine nucleosidase [Polyangiaceae bacterium]|nr:5-methylthioadenosine/S-adenosylhomocysteine nucleosidase [Polyangiaceae bacterium]